LQEKYSRHVWGLPTPTPRAEALCLLLALWPAPAIIAVARRHRHMPAIVALTILAGWTCLGWAPALVWSLSDTEPRR
jgi:hypothetical protein